MEDKMGPRVALIREAGKRQTGGTEEGGDSLMVSCAGHCPQAPSKLVSGQTKRRKRDAVALLFRFHAVLPSSEREELSKNSKYMCPIRSLVLHASSKHSDAASELASFLYLCSLSSQEQRIQPNPAQLQVSMIKESYLGQGGAEEEPGSSRNSVSVYLNTGKVWHIVLDCHLSTVQADRHTGTVGAPLIVLLP
ncbi:hypothetical protein B296_00048172 [Ensete ventricosum]|uniref:Uncharacterized protein n=1 Tax=Ensete ventricosum TaxID=4639 RepID=A0A426XDI3_ENSVE|nr:hypothetical protein B296_00048172 [Ensete ventricosum]